MSGRPTIDKGEARTLRAQGWTLQRLADRYGVTRSAVSLSLSRTTRRDNQTPTSTPCEHCGAESLSRRRFCSRACYFAHVRVPGARVSRNGQRAARAVVALFFALEPGHVVHHEDGDERHNHPSNLRVFASQGQHLQYHRTKERPAPLWDGTHLGPGDILTARTFLVRRANRGERGVMNVGGPPEAGWERLRRQG